MGKKKLWTYLIGILAGVVVIFGVKTARAIDFGETLSVSGYVRTELDFHTGVMNPNNADILQDSYKVNLFRNTLSTDLVFKPSDQFKLFSKIRLVDDSTERIDSDLPDYNAFPKFKGDETMMRLRDNHDAAEVRELYADISLGNLWLRLGRQQIVWGESDGLRLLDVFNPLDLTQHLFLEPIPEQFENIRIPLWAIRGTYLIPNRYINDLTVEGVFNPGDNVPTQLAETGAPFNLIHLPPFIQLNPESRRGDLSGGGRIYGSVGAVSFTLNYLNTYNQDGISKSEGLVLDPIHGIPLFALAGLPYSPFYPPFMYDLNSIVVKSEHPKINIYGASLNYALESLKAVIRAEFAYTSDQPYESQRDPSEIIERGTFKYVLGFERQTFLLPLSITLQAATVGIQFFQTIREGNEEDLFINQAPVDKEDNVASIYINQAFAHDTVSASLFGAYDFEDAYWIQSGLKYKPGMHWIFDVYANILGGGDKRPGKFGSLDFANGVLGRVSYQF